MKSNAVLIDTNFIIVCIKKRVDFFEAFQNKGCCIIIPQQVLNELEKIHVSNQSITQRNYTHLALEILKNRSQEFQAINLKTKNVDTGILKYAKENPEIRIATLDRALREKLKKQGNSLITLRSNGRIEF